MIGIIDYDAGNLGSLRNALKYLGAEVEIISSTKDVSSCHAILLPGVGAFDTAMSSIKFAGFGNSVKEFVGSGGPVLGICLGMQMFTSASEEGSLPGLDIVKCSTFSLRKLGCTGKLPHVGFNTIQSVCGDSSFFSDAVGRDFYFVHSYAIPEEASLDSYALIEYENVRFMGAFQHKNMFATQFHPEKSGEAGLVLLEHFITCSKNA